MKHLPIVEAEGSPFEIGLQHGRQSAAAVRTNFSYYLNLWNHYCGVEKNTVLEDARIFLPYIEKLDGELIEELKGVAKGAEMQFEEILALNARWELNYAYLFPKEALEGCTAIGVTAEASSDRHMYIGQNWDYKPGVEKSCILLRIRQKHKPDIVMHTEAGLIGHKGFNASGIGICMNFIRCDRDAFRPGVPVWLKVRSLLNCKNLSKCLGILMDHEGPNSANILIGHRDGEVIDAECTPDDIHFLYPKDGVLTHSNHFMSSNFKAKDIGRSLVPDSVIRSERAGRKLTQNRVSLNLEAMKSVLADHFDYPDSICRHRDGSVNPHAQWETLTSLVIDLTEGKMHYTEGPPCSHPYKSIAIDG
ncbi:MAG: hypothetical protein C4530_01535 [Desulfobacteraceae bacterium]|nr:MAG: hypothetical protein C4530_01535 [Desulfobacteraceae bacterium]